MHACRAAPTYGTPALGTFEIRISLIYNRSLCVLACTPAYHAYGMHRIPSASNNTVCCSDEPSAYTYVHKSQVPCDIVRYVEAASSHGHGRSAFDCPASSSILCAFKQRLGRRFHQSLRCVLIKQSLHEHEHACIHACMVTGRLQHTRMHAWRCHRISSSPKMAFKVRALGLFSQLFSLRCLRFLIERRY